MTVHDLVLYVAVVWLASLLGASLVLMVRRGSPASRILALDTLIIMLVGLLVVFAAITRTPYYLDAALALAVLAFVATLAASRYYEEEGTD